MVDKDLCIGCGACVGVCPVGAINMDDDYKANISEECIKCGACEGTCPVSAIEIK